jgi:hypothetical protein
MVLVHLSMPPTGDRGEVGAIEVNAQTGELIINQEIIREITQRANRLATSSSLSTEA